MTAETWRVVWTIEVLLWAAFEVLCLAVFLSTWQASFPARCRALTGVAIVALVGAALVGAAAWRLARRGRAPDSEKLSGRRSVWLTISVCVRVLVLGPVLLFALVASAAGFSA